MYLRKYTLGVALVSLVSAMGTLSLVSADTSSTNVTETGASASSTSYSGAPTTIVNGAPTVSTGIVTVAPNATVVPNLPITVQPSVSIPIPGVGNVSDAATMRQKIISDMKARGWDMSFVTSDLLDASKTTDKQFWDAMKTIKNQENGKMRVKKIAELQSQGFDTSSITSDLLDATKTSDTDFWMAVKALVDTKIGDTTSSSSGMIRPSINTNVDMLRKPKSKKDMPPENTEDTASGSDNADRNHDGTIDSFEQCAFVEGNEPNSCRKLLPKGSKDSKSSRLMNNGSGSAMRNNDSNADAPQSSIERPRRSLLTQNLKNQLDRAIGRIPTEKRIEKLQKVVDRIGVLLDTIDPDSKKAQLLAELQQYLSDRIDSTQEESGILNDIGLFGDDTASADNSGSTMQ